MKKVTAIVVTYNRKDLLSECLGAVLRQSVEVQQIIVINNASTDGTEKMFETNGQFKLDKITCINMETNSGGSGGFYEGIRRAAETDTDWLWVMDDDTIPEERCLEELLDADKIMKGDQISFFASSVYGPKGEFMNVPNVEMKASENGYPSYYQFLGRGLLGIADATFVSLLISKDAVMKCGLPCKDYFIWGDDGEYTLRLTHYYGPAYMVGKSIAIHKRAGNSKLSLDNISDPNRISLFHFYIRNNIINDLLYKSNHRVRTRLKSIIHALLAIKYFKQDKGIMKYCTVWKGTIEGCFQYGRFKKIIDKELSR